MSDPARPGPRSDIPKEPRLDIEDIQGNILAGFNKDYQTLLFLKIIDTAITKAWLRSIVPTIATVDEVLAFNRLFKQIRRHQGGEPRGLAATWVNIAVSFGGLARLTSAAEAEKFRDPGFQFGMPTRSGILGDPTDPTAAGHPRNWVIGGPDNVPDFLLIVASDDPVYLAAEVGRLKESLRDLAPTADGGAALAVIGEQPGVTLPPPLTGHEHFGFKDGVSQPGIRGRLSDAPDDFLTPRWIAPGEPSALFLAAPGQPLIWPGEFVFGYPQQNVFDPLSPLESNTAAVPAWAKNGSYLVFRRLRQDVAAFREFVRATASELASTPPFAGMSPQLLGAKLVGRWPSGAPIMRVPHDDDEDLAQDRFANNHFNFESDTQPISLRPESGHPGDHFPQARSDLEGTICPRAAHIRKANSRDEINDIGGEFPTLARRILRRGIPYGPPFDPAHDSPQDDRGLLFLSYQTSIVDQFEFLIANWANDPDVPHHGGGHDPIIGQSTSAAARNRTFGLAAEDGSGSVITLPREWVVATGGGYFFAPSITALTNVLAG